MDIVYYYNKKEKVCPVSLYLEKEIANSSKISEEGKEKIVKKIKGKLEYIKENKGIAEPPIAKPIQGYKIFQIMQRKDEKTLIRLLCAKYKSLIILLDIFEKPDNYDDKRNKKKIEWHYKKAQTYFEDFKKDPANNYKRI